MRTRGLSSTPVDIDELCRELEIPTEFPAEVIAEADEAAHRKPPDVPDATDLPFVTIDPTGSTDLDQAVCIKGREGGGWVVHYAIADVAHFVTPDGPLDIESQHRGETLYAPQRRIPLYPDVLGEGAMSLLADVVRPALLRRIDVDATGEVVDYDLGRALVKSRAKLDYQSVQAAHDSTTLPPAIAALGEFGTTRHERGLTHGAIELNLPEQHVDADNGTWSLTYRSQLPVEMWNAQVSLLTGAVAANIMCKGHIGLLRTLPPAEPRAVERLRRAAPGLGVAWPDGDTPGQVIASLDLTDPMHVAFVELASELLRGAGYTSFDGDLPEQPSHAGIGGAYAHVTAPIRRLCDRYANEVCVALMAQSEVPEWAASKLTQVPDWMTASTHLAHKFERAIINGTEAFMLASRVGEAFEATVVDVDEERNRATITLDTPAVSARCDGEAIPLGQKVTVRLVEADVAKRAIRFSYPV